jgi:hypothetical protein
MLLVGPPIHAKRPNTKADMWCNLKSPTELFRTVLRRACLKEVHLTHRVGAPAPVEGAIHRRGTPAPMRCTRARTARGQDRGPSRVTTPGSVCPDAHTASTDDVVDSVPWTLLTSPKRDFGDGGGSNGRGAPINKLIQCHRHCKEHGGERFDPITPSCSPSGGAHANVYMSMCATEVEE